MTIPIGPISSPWYGNTVSRVIVEPKPISVDKSTEPQEIQLMPIRLVIDPKPEIPIDRYVYFFAV